MHSDTPTAIPVSKNSAAKADTDTHIEAEGDSSRLDSNGDTSIPEDAANANSATEFPCHFMINIKQ